MKVVAAVRLEIFSGVSLAHGACLCGGLIKKKQQQQQQKMDKTILLTSGLH